MFSAATQLIGLVASLCVGHALGGFIVDLTDPFVVADLLEEEPDEIIHLFNNEPDMFQALVEDEGLYDMDHADMKRHLQTSGYTDPSWWKEYKQQFGKHFKRCKALANVAPIDGSQCPRMRVGDYICMFDDQTCSDGSVQPKIKCDCLSADRRWACEEYDACAVKPVVDTCPEDFPLLHNPPLACTGDLTCGYGEQECCDHAYPKYDCSCVDGEFKCNNNNSCKPPVVCLDPVPVCPSEVPIMGGTCDMTVNTDSCGYGQSCCPNGDCSTEMSCSCMDGMWACMTADILCPATAVEVCPTNSADLHTYPFTNEFGACNPDSIPCEYGEACCEQCGKQVDCVSPTMGCTCTGETGWLCWMSAIACSLSSEPCPPDIDETPCETIGEVNEDFGTWWCCTNENPKARCTCGDDNMWACDVLYSPYIACSCAFPLPEPEPLLPDDPVDNTNSSSI